MLQVKDVWTGQNTTVLGRRALHKEIAPMSCSFLIVSETNADSFQEVEII